MVQVCVHHWMLGSPDGNPTVQGICKKCGDERPFVVGEHIEVKYRQALPAGQKSYKTTVMPTSQSSRGMHQT